MINDNSDQDNTTQQEETRSKYLNNKVGMLFFFVTD